MTAPTPAAGRLARLVGDLPSPGPAYAHLADRIRLLIADGGLPLDSRLPSERDLSTALRLSRTTVTRAYAALRDEGYLTSRVGSGSRVALPARIRGAVGSDGSIVPAEVAAGDIDLLCAATRATNGVLTAYEAAVAELPGHLTTAGYHPAGLPSLRAAIAERYAQRGLPTTPDQVIVTTGAIAGVGLLIGTLVRPGARVLVESPGYPNTISALRARGARLVPLPVEPTGWDIASSVEVVRSAHASAAVLLPDFHNPTGSLMPDDDRARLARALRRSGVVTIVDETVAELDLDPEAGPLPLPWAAHDEHAITVGSSSKSHWGGLRIGWIRTPVSLVDQVGQAAGAAGLGAPVLEQLTLLHLLATAPGLSDNRRRLIVEARAATVEELRTRLPGARFVVPRGGLSLWVELPEVNATQVAIAALDEGLHLAAGPRFAVGHGLTRWVRVPHVAETETQREAVRRLAAAYDRVRAGEVPRRARTPRAIVA